jgi:membrane protein DedA with SNARE-associated domain
MSSQTPEGFGWVLEIIASYGYVAVALLVALEVVVPPIPSEVILPLSGFLVGLGRLSFVGVVAAATLGSVLGALTLYGLGYWLGEERMREFVGRHGRYMFLKQEDVDRAQEWFDRHGGKAVLIGRMVPFVRSIISLPAGVARMPLGKFVGYTALGSGLWNALLIGAGWALGEQWELIAPYQSLLARAAQVGLAVAVAWFFWRRFVRHRAASGGR